MADERQYAYVQFRRGDQAYWDQRDTDGAYLLLGEPGVLVQDGPDVLKLGDGVSKFANLPAYGDNDDLLTYDPDKAAYIVRGATAQIATVNNPGNIDNTVAAYFRTPSETSSAADVRYRRVIDVRDFGAKGDFQTVADGNISGRVVTSATMEFAAGDVGKNITVYANDTGIGSNANHLNGNIVSVAGGTATVDFTAPEPRTSVRVDWASDDRAAIQAAIDFTQAADSDNGWKPVYEIVLDPSVVTWWVSGPLVIGTQDKPSTPVTIRGGSTSGAEFTGSEFLTRRKWFGQTVIQKASSKAGHDIIQHYGYGLTLERLAFDGRMASGYLFRNDFSFELRINQCRFGRVYGTGVFIRTANNGQANDVHVNNCGLGRSAPAVKILSRRNADNTLSPSNTFHWNNLHLEYNSGVDLDIASGTALDEYAEYHKFNHLHVETTTNPWYNPTGDEPKQVPGVVIGNVRSVEFVASMFYGRGPSTVEVKSQADIAGVEYGVTFAACDFIGVATTVRHLDIIELLRGTVALIGTKFSGATTEYVRIAAAFTGRFITGGVHWGENVVPIPSAGRITDLRTTLRARQFEMLVSDQDVGTVGTAHIVSRTPESGSDRPTIARASGLGTTPPAATISGSDAQGQIVFGTASDPSAGLILTITPKRAYGGTPRVFLTAGNPAAAALLAGGYYIGTAPGSWSIYLLNAPTASTTGIQLSYWAIDSGR